MAPWSRTVLVVRMLAGHQQQSALRASSFTTHRAGFRDNGNEFGMDGWDMRTLYFHGLVYRSKPAVSVTTHRPRLATT